MRRISRPSRSLLTTSLSLAALLVSTTAAACSGDKTQAGATPVPATTVSRTPTYTYDVVRKYPHDPGAYTEGLLFHEGRLFESTGEIGRSDIREVELETGRVIRKRPLEGKDKNGEGYFGEGIMIVGDRLIELTWKSEVAFIYDWKTFEPKGQFTYQGEGWAFTKNADTLIMSNGSAVLAFRDPKTFAPVRTVEVMDHGVPVPKLNELEWVKGEIWANVWESNQIVRIDPKDGAVLGWIDLTGLRTSTDTNGQEDVLNGIAYDEKNDRLFVTGKRWSYLYEIKLKQRS